MIYLGADHRGYKLKEEIKKFLTEQKTEFQDLGNDKYEENDDYPDFAGKVAEQVSADLGKNKGILICGTGIGMCAAANKFPGVRAGLGLSGYMARRAVEEDDINILCLAADITDIGTAKTIIKEFFQACFKAEEDYARRVKKLDNFLK